MRGASTQEAFGRVLAELSREAEVGERLVTTAPDVAVSTNLGGWINRVGIYGSEDEQSVEGDALQWSVRPAGQHIELGISEMNLFLLLSQLGLAYEHSGHLLVPIGTVYDPFVCRGLDAPDLRALQRRALRDRRHAVRHQPVPRGRRPPVDDHPVDRDGAAGPQLRRAVLSGRGRLAAAPPRRPAPERRRRRREPVPAPLDQARRSGAVRGAASRAAATRRCGRTCSPAATASPSRPRRAESRVSIVACGALLPEALAARDLLWEQDEIGASVVALTSPDIAYRSHQAAATSPISNASRVRPISHLAGLLAPDGRAPIVSVIDGASHCLSFLGGAIGARQIALGVDQFGQCGSLAALYDHHELSPDAIAAAAIAALET